MYAYREAIRQLQEQGYVSDALRARLPPETLQRAIEEATYE